MPVTPADRIESGEISDLWTYILVAHCGITDPDKWTQFDFDRQYHLNDQIKRLARIQELTALEESGDMAAIQAACDAAYEKELNWVKGERAARAVRRDRLLAMLAQFDNWAAPVEWARMKTTALRYVKESIALLDYDLSDPEKEEAEAWLARNIQRLVQVKDRAEGEIDERVYELAKRTTEMCALRNSLEQFRPKPVAQSVK